MADITTAYNLVNNAFVDITIFNIGWILSIPLVLGTAWIITRDKDAQGFLWLPLTIIYHVIGIKPNFLWYIIVTIVFTIKVFSADKVGNFLTTQTRQAYKESGYQFEQTRKTNKKNLLEKMFLSKEGTENNSTFGKMTKKELYNAIMKGRGKL